MKRETFVLVLAVFLGWNAHAQEAHKNAINFGLSGLFGISVGYERLFTPNFSMALDTGLGWILSPTFFATIGFRLYPFDSGEKPVGFFVAGSVGYGEIQEKEPLFLWEEERDSYDIWGLMFSPSIGIKIGAGKPKGFIFTPIIGADIFLGKKTLYNGSYLNNYKGGSEIGWGFNPHIKLLFGVAF